MTVRVALRRVLGSYVGNGLTALAELMVLVPSHQARLFIYRRVFRMTIGAQSTIYRTPEIRAGQNVLIGSHTSIGKNVILDGRSGIRIGDSVNLSSEVAIWTLQHDMNDPAFATKGGPVVIGDYAWVSFRATILPGVTIGHGAVVAANSVVTKDVDPYSVVAGIPAKEIARRSEDLEYKLVHRAPFL